MHAIFCIENHWTMSSINTPCWKLSPMAGFMKPPLERASFSKGMSFFSPLERPFKISVSQSFLTLLTYSFLKTKGEGKCFLKFYTFS